MNNVKWYYNLENDRIYKLNKSKTKFWCRTYQIWSQSYMYGEKPSLINKHIKDLVLVPLV